MKYAIAILLALTLTTNVALSDWDPVLEAQEQAQREAAQRREAEQRREAQRMRSEAEAKASQRIMADKRKALGAAAAGKSDAEVSKLYDAKIKQDRAEAQQALDTARAAMSSGQGAAALKRFTGKSLAELENMSDEEAEAFTNEMERRYGQ